MLFSGIKQKTELKIRQKTKTTHGPNRKISQLYAIRHAVRRGQSDGTEH